MPNSCVINAKSAEILRKFVAGGGTLIADGEPGITSNINQGKSCFNGSSDIFGFTPSGGIKAYTPVDYMKINDDFYFKDGQGILPMTDYLVETEDITAEIIAKAYPPAKGSYSGKPEKPVMGYAEVRVIPKNEDIGNFTDCAIAQLMTTLHRLLEEKNVAPRDIAILMRTKKNKMQKLGQHNKSTKKERKVVEKKAQQPKAEKKEEVAEEKVKGKFSGKKHQQVAKKGKGAKKVVPGRKVAGK